MMATLNGVKVNNARYVNPELVQLYKDAKVIDANTSKAGDVGTYLLKNYVKSNLRINDEQVAINSINWIGLPPTLDQNLVERILYYRGQGALFFFENQWWFLPFALGSKGIDVYGRFINITPLPFNGSVSTDDKKPLKPWIQGLEFDVLYDLPSKEEYTIEELEGKAIILTDYSRQLSQTVLARQALDEPIIDLESDLLPFCRTALLNSTGVQGMKVGSPAEVDNVRAASRAMNHAAITGEKWIAIEGQVDFQELTNGSIANADQFLMTMQSIDNYRLSLHGVDSGGIFQKQAHMLESESQMNTGKSSYALQDRIFQRQHFCDLANAWFGLGVWAMASETALGADIDQDGDSYDEETQSQEQTETSGGDSNDSNE